MITRIGQCGQDQHEDRNDDSDDIEDPIVHFLGHRDPDDAQDEPDRSERKHAEDDRKDPEDVRPTVIDDLGSVVGFDPPFRFRKGIAFVFGPAIGTKTIIIVDLASAMMAKHKVLTWSDTIIL